MKKTDESTQKDDVLHGIDHHTEVHVVEKKEVAAQEEDRVGTYSTFDIKKKKNFVIVSIVVLFILVLGFLAFFVSRGSKTVEPESEVVFSVYDQDYTRGDIESYIRDAEDIGLGESEVIDLAREAYVYKYIAGKYDITIDDDQKIAALAPFDSLSGIGIINNSWVELMGFRFAMIDYVQSLGQSGPKGYVYTFYFGSLIDTYTEESVPDLKPIAGAGEAELIDRDERYAREKSEEYREAIANGSLAPDEVYDLIMEDERLHFAYILPNRIDSWTQKFGYDNNQSWRDEVAIRPLVEFIEGFGKTGQPSDIQTARVPYINLPDEEYDAYYFFVYLEESDTRVAEIQKILMENEVILL